MSICVSSADSAEDDDAPPHSLGLNGLGCDWYGADADAGAGTSPIQGAVWDVDCFRKDKIRRRSWPTLPPIEEHDVESCPSSPTLARFGGSEFVSPELAGQMSSMSQRLDLIELRVSGELTHRLDRMELEMTTAFQETMRLRSLLETRVCDLRQYEDDQRNILSEKYSSAIECLQGALMTGFQELRSVLVKASDPTHGMSFDVTGHYGSERTCYADIEPPRHEHGTQPTCSASAHMDQAFDAFAVNVDKSVGLHKLELFVKDMIGDCQDSQEGPPDNQPHGIAIVDPISGRDGLGDNGFSEADQSDRTRQCDFDEKPIGWTPDAQASADRTAELEQVARDLAFLRARLQDDGENDSPTATSFSKVVPCQHEASTVVQGSHGFDSVPQAINNIQPSGCSGSFPPLGISSAMATIAPVKSVTPVSSPPTSVAAPIALPGVAFVNNAAAVSPPSSFVAPATTMTVAPNKAAATVVAASGKPPVRTGVFTYSTRQTWPRRA